MAVAAAGSQSGATPACTADARSSVSLGAGNIFEGEWKEGKPQLKDSKNKGLVGQHSGNTGPLRARRRPSPRPASATPSDSARGPQPLSACGGCLRPPPAPAPSSACPFAPGGPAAVAQRVGRPGAAAIAEARRLRVSHDRRPRRQPLAARREPLCAPRCRPPLATLLARLASLCSAPPALLPLGCRPSATKIT